MTKCTFVFTHNSLYPVIIIVFTETEYDVHYIFYFYSDPPEIFPFDVVHALERISLIIFFTIINFIEKVVF